ncbi:hypothetical protein BaRGS_00028784 [Batillaria attramentaria]|uniref:Uncharacterized protein n=1 Tax=Batillaria attramentaria TaxID=370345 RepID=A0ABD0JYZ7_9CAEN
MSYTDLFRATTATSFLPTVLYRPLQSDFFHLILANCLKQTSTKRSLPSLPCLLNQTDLYKAVFAVSSLSTASNRPLQSGLCHLFLVYCLKQTSTKRSLPSLPCLLPQADLYKAVFAVSSLSTASNRPLQSGLCHLFLVYGLKQTSTKRSLPSLSCLLPQADLYKAVFAISSLSTASSRPLQSGLCYLFLVYGLKQTSTKRSLLPLPCLRPQTDLYKAVFATSSLSTASNRPLQSGLCHLFLVYGLKQTSTKRSLPSLPCLLPYTTQASLEWAVF